VSEPNGCDETVEQFLTLPPATSQSQIQQTLDGIYRRKGLAAVMECLFRWELEVGYITEEKLRDNERHSFRDPETGIDFRLQINVARSRYCPSAEGGSDLAPVHCVICRENVGRPGKETLRIFEFLLDGEPFFLQLTPFPLFTHHFVLIMVEPKPQKVDARAVSWMFHFLRLVPQYTVCSNSDVEWAGSSILEHLHFQVFKSLHLPVMDASPLENSIRTDGRLICEDRARPEHCVSSESCLHADGSGSRDETARVDLLHYPMGALRVCGPSAAVVERIGVALIETWKRRDPGRNTVNLVLRREAGGYRFYIFLRNPDFRTPSVLQHIKSEGVGVIEAAGEIILPVPEEASVLRRIRERGLEVILGILEGNDPVGSRKREQLAELVRSALRAMSIDGRGE
jgi:UDPglucose--hexose-1-phosphate uridylyltransferase